LKGRGDSILERKVLREGTRKRRDESLSETTQREKSI